MFWSGNFIFVRELNFLLKEENVSLKQVLEADDILQECKADNKALIQFLTKPEILAELITLITEEPPKDVELTAQYRHASVACEVLTSHLSMLSDRLSLDTVQMHRLCDFINREPPLNPLLASYFSKTIEMLLERSPKQDWYLHHIVCLRVLDFLRARRDFLPNVLRHAHTSALCDTLKCFVRVDELFNKLVLEWLEEHQVLENLINIVCGTYVPPPIEPSPAHAVTPAATADPPAPAPAPAEPPAGPAAPADPPEPCAVQAVKEIIEQVKQIQMNHLDADGADDQVNVSIESTPTENCVNEPDQSDTPPTNIETTSGQTTNPESSEPTQAPSDVTTEDTPEESAPKPEVRTYASVTRNVEAKREAARAEGGSDEAAVRRAAVAASNAAALLCDLINNGCAVDVCANRSLTSWALVARLQSERLVRHLLSAMFTSPAGARHAALQHGARLLRALLDVNHPALSQGGAGPAGTGGTGGADSGAGGAETRSCVELCVAPHLPLLHHALLQPPAPAPTTLHTAAVRASGQSERGDVGCGGGGGGGGCGGGESVGAARVEVAALLAHLAHSDVQEVPNTMITLGTPGMLVDMFFRYPHNSFLHAEVVALVRHALHNARAAFRASYARHLVNECDLLTRLIDVYEEEEVKRQSGGTRSAYMGHVTLMLRQLAQVLEPDGELLQQLQPGAALLQRWRDFLLDKFHPPENIYEDANMAPNMDATYEFNELPADELARCDMPPHDAPLEGAGAGAGGEARARGSREEFDDDDDRMENSKRSFLDLASERFGDDMWEDSPGGDDDEEGLPEGVFGVPGVHQVLDDVSPWESGSSGAFESSEMASAFDTDSGGGGGAGGGAGGGWAQFSQVCAPPVDPFAPLSHPPPDNAAAAAAAAAPSAGDTQPPAPAVLFGDESFEDPMKLRLEPHAHTHSHSHNAAELSEHDGSAELANNLLTAMSAMAPDVIANIVNANLAPVPADPGDPSAPAPAPAPALSAPSDTAGAGAGAGAPPDREES